MSKEIIGRLVLEASTGIHGYVAKDLSEHLASILQQRAEMLDALKLIIEKYEESNDIGDLKYWPFEDAKSLISTME